ncbi:MAG TPA: 4Fe-4S binding protein [Kineosporiaceae bacterium]
MPNLITEDCVSCGICEPECPNEAISQGDEFYVIDADMCNECADDGGEPHCLDVCPVDGAVVTA